MTELRVIRQKKAISLEELSAKTGITINTLSRIERGLRTPRHSTKRKIADALGMKPEEIEFPQPRAQTERQKVSFLRRIIG